VSTRTDIRQVQADSYTHNMRLVAHHDLNGRGDGMQILKVGDFVYVAHLGASDMALSILDCTDPSDPQLVRQIEHPPNTHRHKVQIVGDVLIQNSERPSRSVIETSARYTGRRDEDASPVTGLEIFDLQDPTDPRPVGFHPVPGTGVHRIWYSEPPYAHIAAWLPEVSERAYQIVDLSDPANPELAGAWWIPGTRRGDSHAWPALAEREHFAVHGIIPNGDRAYVACTDAGLVVLDISDVRTPRFISRVDWSPPYGGYVHTGLPLPERGLVIAVDESVRPTRAEDGDKRVWVVDVREEQQPVTVSTFPIPQPPAGAPWASFDDRPLRFGPHNVHENRPGSFQSEELIFVTYFNAGLRVVDISDPHRPEEVAYFVPPPPPGQEAPQANDLFVDVNGLVYLTDRLTGGMYVVEYNG